MRRVVSWLTVAYRVLLVGLAPALYLSYLPVISFGGDATMNYELSVAEIWLVLMDVVGALLILARGEALGVLRRWGRRRWMWLFFPVYVVVSVAWSLNAARGWLTALMMLCIAVAVMVIWELRDILDERWRRYWWRGFVAGTLAACGWCVAQCVMDVAGVSREVTGMCEGCVSAMFGFPHPNGFAIEPQFMGNLLLAPGIVTMIVVADGFKIHSSSGRVAQARRYGLRALILGRNLRKPSDEVFLKPSSAILFFTIVVATIFLTFSRGAIYAFMISVVAITIYYIVRRRAWKGVMVVWGVVAVAFTLVLNLQGLMAEVGPTNDTYGTAVAKAINHLTLGVVDVRGETVKNAADGGEIENEEMEITSSSPSPSETEAVFDGYVAESTETRVRLTNAAFEVWRSNPATMVAGVGIGGAGVALYQAELSPAPKEIVQNEYASLLLETGLIGVILAGVMMVSMIAMLVRRRAVVVLVLMWAYGVTLLFFSGLPNALQIYIMPVLILAIYSESRKKLVS